MNVYAFTKGDQKTPSSRQRWYALKEFLQGLDSNGLYSEPFPDCYSFWKIPFLQRIATSFKIFTFILKRKKTDIFFLQRPIYNKYLYTPLVVGLFIKKPRIVFDVDDAIYTHSPEKTRMLARMADVITVGNHELLKWFKQYNNNTYLVPTSLDFDLYEKISSQEKNDDTKCVIGWVGSGKAHEENLKLLRAPLDELSKRHDFTFRIIGAQGQESIHRYWENSKHKFKVDIIDNLDWSNPEAVPRQISYFTIGVMPLLDTPFNRGKSSFKALEYMACSKPAVISGVGENSLLIEEGVTGYIANTSEEWALKLHQLITDQNLRARIGGAAKNFVREKYSYQSNAKKIYSILRSL